jgi:hypothetical protein
VRCLLSSTYNLPLQIWILSFASYTDTFTLQNHTVIPRYLTCHRQAGLLYRTVELPTPPSLLWLEPRSGLNITFSATTSSARPNSKQSLRARFEHILLGSPCNPATRGFLAIRMRGPRRLSPAIRDRAKASLSHFGCASSLILENNKHNGRFREPRDSQQGMLVCWRCGGAESRELIQTVLHCALGQG